MTGYLKRLMGLMLVLSTSTWAQAVCPMMLFPHTAKECGQHATHPAAASSKGSEHECCPGMRARMQKDHCERAKVSSCDSAMSCCAVEREPASTSKISAAGNDISVVGRVMPAALQAPSRAVTLELSAASPPERGVLSLKEDLRI
jgi:hypothetical protein